MAKLDSRFLSDLSSIYVTQAEVGNPSGVASLDGSGKVPVSQLPNSVMEFQGSWNPSTNTPTLIDGTGDIGDVYWITVAFAGPVAGLSDASMINFQIGDLVIYNGTVWQLTTPAAGVSAVNGAQGAVTVNAINQLTGDVITTAASGSQSKASSLVATSNSTLTSLPSLTSAVTLASIGTITTGTWNGTATSGSSFITSGVTYTTPAGITTNTKFKFTLVGAGGGGGGSSNANRTGSGGGGGATGILQISGLSPSTGYTIVIGAGGAGGIGLGVRAGVAGGNTSITIGATTYTAGGGAGGLGTTGNIGGVGGTATNCTINIQGQPGQVGNTSGGYASGGGGHSLFGFGAYGLANNNNNGVAGQLYGGGGGGGIGNAFDGGSGAAGAIIVEWQN